MSTWHQRQNMPVLYHHELWTVVTDPPEQPLCIDRYRDPIEAQRVCDAINQRNPHTAYVLAPHKEDK
jgi:hypothetical protein